MSKMLNTKQASVVLGVHESTMRLMRMEGRGPAYHQMSAHSFRYDERDLQAWLAGRRVVPVRASMEEAFATS